MGASPGSARTAEWGRWVLGVQATGEGRRAQKISRLVTAELPPLEQELATRILPRVRVFVHTHPLVDPTGRYFGAIVQ